MALLLPPINVTTRTEQNCYSVVRIVCVAQRQRSPAAGSGSDIGGRVDRERGHGCLFSRSLSTLLVSLSISSSFPVADSHAGQVCVPLAPFALQMSAPCHPSPCHGCSPSPTTPMAP